MTVTSWVAQRLLKLPPATARKVAVERDLRITADDGVTLLADRWSPAPGSHRAKDLPTALVRSPYGRKGPLGWLMGRLLAERGFHVVIVSTRGTFGSGGGEFRAMRQERADGHAVLRWLAEQPWCNGSVVLTGASYLGYTQWVVAADAPVQVKAMVPHVTSSRLAMTFLRPGRIELETLMNWSVLTANQERPFAGLRASLGRKKVEAAMRTLPLVDGDKAALGRDWPFYQDCLHHDQDDPYWQDEDFTAAVADVKVPVSSIAGWYDIFLSDQLKDYQALVAAGRPPRLTIGPWAHSSPPGLAAAIWETVRWAGPLARGAKPGYRAPVRLFVMGVKQWREFDQWPPAGYTQQRWHLREGNALGKEPAAFVAPSAFTYDPSDPTPSLGGAKLEARGAGAVDNRPLEKRSDVLTFTSDVLDGDVEVIGEVAAEVWLRADRPSCDLFVRVCDVDRQGRSVNICDDLVKVRPDGIAKVPVQLSPTAHVFRRGHRIRVLVAAGAFPRYARNLGGDEPVPTAATPHVTNLEIFHDAAHPSAILLPVK
jgi:putative CocE/NonD family hydrolase